ncbi:hypothetical protein PIB30_074552 [Stylosanthes scabra]|uniref:Uncharacterized protein n=1 Tax=Stylosanthes scabra TaxID=79078 RepID=A0ABU6SQZ9_9FABA|nr:hypothetical protein [Stylosanthes scabra]
MTQRSFDETFEDMSDKITTWSLPPDFGLELLNYILSGSYSATKLLEKKDFPMDNWPLRDVRGIPNRNTSENSQVWMLEWMAIENMFQPNLTARALTKKFECSPHAKNLTRNHNEVGHMVRQRSNARWKALISK